MGQLHPTKLYVTSHVLQPSQSWWQRRCLLATRWILVPGLRLWCIDVNDDVSIKSSETISTRDAYDTWSMPTIGVGMVRNALYSGISKGRKWCQADVSHNSLPTADWRSLMSTCCGDFKMCSIWVQSLDSLSRGICTVNVRTQIDHPIQASCCAKAALCQENGTPKNHVKNDSADHKGADCCSGQVRRSSTYCHKVWWWSRREWPKSAPSIQRQDSSKSHWP